MTHVEDAMPQGVPAMGGRPGHESNWIGLRSLAIFTAGLITTIVVVQLLLVLLMKGLEHREERVEALYRGRKAIEIDQFPNPQLQQNPADDLVRMKAEEQRRITSYGWVDRKAGIARIPVDRAVDILARSGLPKVAAPAPDPGTPPGVFIPPGTKREEPQSNPKQGEKP
jgi:hypothetical protein